MSRDASARELAETEGNLRPGCAPVLSVEGLTKRYGKKEAVSDVSFTVRQAELIGLLGPNGAGKSTTLRMIAGCLAPTAGYVHITGFDAAEQPGAAKSRIGYLPETPPLYPDMTVGEYLRFARNLKNVPERNRSGDAPSTDDAAWMDSLVSDLEIANVMPVLIRNLSRGFRQRVGIAAAIAGRPALLLLDEPASGLDPRQVADFRSLLRRISAHMAIVLSSHGLYEIASLCTRIIIMNKGRIAADGAPDELARMSAGAKTGGAAEASGDPRLAAEMVRALEDTFISLTDPVRSAGEET